MGAFALVYLAGAILTVVAFTVLFRKRYPKRASWLVVGIAVGVVAMFLWPATLWVAVAMWATGFTRRSASVRRKFPKKFVIPLSACGAVASLVVMGTVTPPPAPETASNVETLAAAGDVTPPPTTSPAPPAPPPIIAVADVIDGDTVVLTSGTVVRIIGINAPELTGSNSSTECGAPEAVAFARQTLLDKPVTLVADPTQSPVDPGGHTLSYILLPDGRDFSVMAAETGHARADALGSTPPQRSATIAAAESRARSAGLGLWGPACSPPPAPPVPSSAPQPAPQLLAQPAPRPAPQPAPQPVVREPAPQPVAAPAPRPVREPAPQPAPRSEPAAVSYKNCTEVKAAGAAPIRRGEPGYASHLDRDNDGIACET